MMKAAKALGKWVASYLLASAACMLQIKWPHFEGHADVPFSAFPAFLVWSPLAPGLLVQDAALGVRGAWPGLAVFCAVFAVSFWLMFRGRRRAGASN